MINNYQLVREFVPGGLKGPPADGDLFLYTELMDRTKRVGNNGVRIVKTFFHRNLDDFDRHFTLMQKICDAMGVRAYTRLAPRSFEATAQLNARLVLDALISKNHAGVKTLYPSACGKVTPVRKIWLFDVDVISDKSKLFGDWLGFRGHLLETIPSKKGLHYISKPFDKRLLTGELSDQIGSMDCIMPEGVSLHLDNSTNLYVPDNAA